MAKPVQSSGEVVENSWTTKAPMQQARAELGVAVVNGKIYAIGGFTGGQEGLLGELAYESFSPYQDTVEEYSPTSDLWIFKEPMPTPRARFAISVYQDKIYCIGGKTDNGETGVNEVYNPETDTWQTKAPMPMSASFLMASVVANNIYVVGGYPFSSTTFSYAYDPATDTWTKKASMPFNAFSSASVVWGGEIYVIGGANLITDSEANLTEIYNPNSNKWRFGAESPNRTVCASAGITSGAIAPKRIYVFDQAATQVYDMASGNWTLGAQMPTSRINSGVAVINDTFYVIGGSVLVGSLIGGILHSPANEQYIPLEYGTVTNKSLPLLFRVEVLVVGSIFVAIIVGISLIVYLKKRRSRLDYV
jgi:Kelch motif